MANILSRLGRSLHTPTTRMLMAGALTGAAAQGFHQGVTSSNLSDKFYDVTTGNPNADRDILGTDFGVGSMIMGSSMPSWFNPTRVGMAGIRPSAPTAIAGGALGTGFGVTAGVSLGVLAGSMFGSRKAAVRLGLAGGIMGGVVGGAVGTVGAAFGPQLQSGFYNKTTLSDYFKYNTDLARYQKAKVNISGDIVLGAYNARMGTGYY